ncbi:uncharacterized protein BDZ99DRAFT_508580 [Mytilinidion resinicola]|uniref:Beta-glucuronidase C-terminal domain-containing protein n=1 Tax=Mytilinidion resinicola TaxID=574789 RepID=A0A6A6YN05_9PEZI|nr:uncharacterized protein BDZ99DRAFT_508580 [Mytilinidion resinicola]KAF2809963.1 hypothetical protein BDZ99DRAFT_508580 [Mytilinidion resinicola]
MAPSRFLAFAVVFIATVAGQAPTFAAAPAGTPLRRPTDFNAVAVDATPAKAGGVLPESFVSFSIELAFFPDFAGNLSNPNTFSNTLLDNIKESSGTKPYIRVGGNTQYVRAVELYRVVSFPCIKKTANLHYPTILSIGPLFFESYLTWPDTKFIHGFNLGKNSTAARESLIASVPLACKALSEGKLLYWELGNEPDLYKTSAQGPVRPSNWTEADYVSEWNSVVGDIRAAMMDSDPDFATSSQFKWIAPSFGGVGNSLKAVPTWLDGLNANANIALFSSHNYIAGATQPGVTLQHTLLNHTATTTSLLQHTLEHRNLTAHAMPLPYILGEANSLYNQGRAGLSNTFGAALWGVDFALAAATTGIARVHFHLGTDYRYAAWQPVTTPATAMGTKPPYYANIAVAAALGDLTGARVRVASVPLADDAVTAAAYAVYDGGRLARVMVVDLHGWNCTAGEEEKEERPRTAFDLALPEACRGVGVVQRLLAGGSDAVEGVTFNGRNYDYERDRGRPVVVGGEDEMVWVGEVGG